MIADNIHLFGIAYYKSKKSLRIHVCKMQTISFCMRLVTVFGDLYPFDLSGCLALQINVW